MYTLSDLVVNVVRNNLWFGIGDDYERKPQPTDVEILKYAWGGGKQQGPFDNIDGRYSTENKTEMDKPPPRLSAPEKPLSWTDPAGSGRFPPFSSATLALGRAAGVLESMSVNDLAEAVDGFNLAVERGKRPRNEYVVKES